MSTYGRYWKINQPMRQICTILQKKVLAVSSQNGKKKYYLKKQGTSNITVKCIEYLICIQDNGLKTSKWDYLV